MGFQPLLIELIMNYVKTASFSIFINGIPKCFIKLCRCLRQVDPLFPYLFLMCIEDLVKLFQREKIYKSVKGIQICKGAPYINHLLFADDNVIFCKVDVNSSKNFYRSFTSMLRASGQKINAKKMAIVLAIMLLRG